MNIPLQTMVMETNILKTTKASLVFHVTSQGKILMQHRRREYLGRACVRGIDFKSRLTASTYMNKNLEWKG